MALIKESGVTLWQDEAQHFFMFQTDQNRPDRFEHVVTGHDGDRGMRYQYWWLAITPGSVKRWCRAAIGSCGK